MRNWYTPAFAAAGCALLAMPLLAFARADEKAEDDREKAQARKELKNLEEQRAKIDGRIRDVRKKAGVSGQHGYYFSDGKLAEIPGISGEHSIIVQKALGDAHKHVEEAMKNLPKNFRKFDFNFDKMDKDGHAFKFFIDKDGKQYKWDSKMSDEEKKKFKQQMEKMKIQIHENLKDHKEFKVEVPEFRSFSGGKVITPRIVTPEFRVIEPRPGVGGGDDSRALLEEIRALRDEVEKLRDEVKKGRPGRGGSIERLDKINTL